MIQKLFGQVKQHLINVVDAELKERISKIDLLGFEVEVDIPKVQVDTRYFDSLILQQSVIHKSLKAIVPNSNKFDLLYRWSRDGSIESNIKKLKVAPTLVIYQTDNNKVFGGWTDIAWDNPDS